MTPCKCVLGGPYNIIHTGHMYIYNTVSDDTRIISVLVFNMLVVQLCVFNVQIYVCLAYIPEYLVVYT